MPETKHTPGPWETAHAGHGGKDGFVVDECFVRRGGDNVAIAADIIDPETCRPSEANARLIAAAPDFYAVAAELDRLILVIESAVRWQDPHNHAAVLALLKDNRAAIAKATGADQ